MKTSLDKFQFMVPGAKNMAPFRLDVTGKIIPCSNEVKLLKITIDSELKFKKHIDDLCKHLIKYMLSGEYLTVANAKILANAFIDSQFNHNPFIWMFTGKISINKICKTHHRTLQVVTMNVINHTIKFFNSTITCRFIKDTCTI